MEKFLASAFLILSPLAVQFFAAGGDGHLVANRKAGGVDFLPGTVVAETKTGFRAATETVSEKIPFPTIYQDDPERNWGEEEVVQKGINGSITKKYTIRYWYGQKIERKFLGRLVEKPRPQLVRRGRKKTYRTAFADRCGKFTYYGKLRVFATAYDKNCLGCSETTFTGLKAGYGVVAVDPEVIPLQTRLCVPGYGRAVAGDIGGAIKGKKIDLGFADVKDGWWAAGYTDAYLLK